MKTPGALSTQSVALGFNYKDTDSSTFLGCKKSYCYWYIIIIFFFLLNMMNQSHFSHMIASTAFVNNTPFNVTKLLLNLNRKSLTNRSVKIWNSNKYNNNRLLVKKNVHIKATTQLGSWVRCEKVCEYPIKVL